MRRAVLVGALCGWMGTVRAGFCDGKSTGQHCRRDEVGLALSAPPPSPPGLRRRSVHATHHACAPPAPPPSPVRYPLPPTPHPPHPPTHLGQLPEMKELQSIAIALSAPPPSPPSASAPYRSLLPFSPAPPLTSPNSQHRTQLTLAVADLSGWHAKGARRAALPTRLD
eukprot:COSAG02_NODE_1186_length_14006_cov_5.088948_8_plen_168_part_00